MLFIPLHSSFGRSKALSLSDLKLQIDHRPSNFVVGVCVRMAKGRNRYASKRVHATECVRESEKLATKYKKPCQATSPIREVGQAGEGYGGTS